MIISQPALLCLESTLHRLLGRRVPNAIDREEIEARRPELQATFATSSEPRGETAPVAIAKDATTVAANGLAADAPLSAAERRARAAALRALAFSRQRRFDAARTAFAVAARLDPALDLTRTPTFWQLERAAHEAAIDAYTDAGRDADAAVLRARVRSTFRPRPLRTASAAAALP